MYIPVCVCVVWCASIVVLCVHATTIALGSMCPHRAVVFLCCWCGAICPPVWRTLIASSTATHTHTHTDLIYSPCQSATYVYIRQLFYTHARKRVKRVVVVVVAVCECKSRDTFTSERERRSTRSPKGNISVLLPVMMCFGSADGCGSISTTRLVLQCFVQCGPSTAPRARSRR